MDSHKWFLFLFVFLASVYAILSVSWFSWQSLLLCVCLYLYWWSTVFINLFLRISGEWKMIYLSFAGEWVFICPKKEKRDGGKAFWQENNWFTCSGLSCLFFSVRNNIYLATCCVSKLLSIRTRLGLSAVESGL